MLCLLLSGPAFAQFLYSLSEAGEFLGHWNRFRDSNSKTEGDIYIYISLLIMAVIVLHCNSSIIV